MILDSWKSHLGVMSHPEMWARFGDSLPVVKCSKMNDLLLLG